MRSEARQAELKEIIYGFCLSQCLHVAARLGIADNLEDGSKSSAELADLTGSHPAALRRILRALASIGIFSEDEDDCFSLTPLADLLRTDVDGSLRAEILHVLHPTSWLPWGQLLHSVKTGQAAFVEVFEESAWAYRAHNSETDAIFEAMAAAHAKQQADVILEHLDLSTVGRIVDVGGGSGEVIAIILSRQADLRGVLFDQPHVVARAKEVLRAAGVADRCRIEAGDFFIEIPREGDLYLLKAILHNWSDEAAMDILRNCRRAMSAGGRIVLAESLIDSERTPVANFMDLHMLVIHGGKQRTSAELGALLKAAGFCLQGIQKTAGDFSLIEGVAT